MKKIGNLNKYILSKSTTCKLNRQVYFSYPKFQMFESLKEFISNKLNKGLLFDSNKNLELNEKLNTPKPKPVKPTTDIIPKTPSK